jgi:hypothetical protein
MVVGRRRLRAWRERGMRGHEDGWHMRHAGVDPTLGASEDGITIGRWGCRRGHGCPKSTLSS